jgi:hypothetical protein
MAFDWSALDSKDRIEIPARPRNGIWTPARGYLAAGSILRIEASGAWQPLAGTPCGADGLRHWAYGRDRLLTKNAPIGALIGKVGGGNAYAADADIIVIGSLCVLKLDKSEGPLYLTINDAQDGFDDNDGFLTVTFS